MKNHSTTFTLTAVIVCLSLSVASLAAPNQIALLPDYHKEKQVTKHASGTFDVKLSPQTDDKVGDPTVGRMSIDKQFHGDLEGTSKGQMLMTGTPTEGSAGYVAIERVTGKLDGLSGTFALQHSGTMNRGTAELSVRVIPDSGTDGLAGISGKMTIKIVEGKHLYEFAYTIAVEL